MSDFQSAPTYASPILVDEQQLPGASFNPIWLKWFVDLTQILNDIGAGGGIPISSIEVGGAQPFQILIINGAGTAWQAANVASTYTPTLTPGVNVAAATPYVTSYARISNMVHVWGKVDIDPTAGGGVATELGLSLPIASNLANEQELAGVAFAPAVANAGAAILGDTANDRASIRFLSGFTANSTMSFNFSYRVI